MRRLFTDDDVEQAVTVPPLDTRAYFRGECIRRFPEAIAAASWDSVVFDIPGREALLRVPLIDPLRGTRDHVQALLDGSPDAERLIGSLAADAG